mgnify:CR=1 FL=1|jgi:hypothetical protein
MLFFLNLDILKFLVYFLEDDRNVLAEFNLSYFFYYFILIDDFVYCLKDESIFEVLTGILEKVQQKSMLLSLFSISYIEVDTYFEITQSKSDTEILVSLSNPLYFSTDVSTVSAD